MAGIRERHIIRAIWNDATTKTIKARAVMRTAQQQDTFAKSARPVEGTHAEQSTETDGFVLLLSIQDQ